MKLNGLWDKREKRSCGIIARTRKFRVRVLAVAIAKHKGGDGGVGGCNLSARAPETHRFPTPCGPTRLDPQTLQRQPLAHSRCFEGRGEGQHIHKCNE